MKKLLIAFLSILFLSTTQAGTISIKNNNPQELPQYFRDVSAKSKLNIAIDSAISRGILEKGSFFRAEAEVPATMFLDVLLKDLGITPKSNKFSDILTEAVAQEIISKQVSANLQFDTPMTRLRAIEALIKIKKILPPRRVSQKFRGIFPLASLVGVKDLPYIEAAVASGILTESELKFFQPNEAVSRREFITWIYNYFDHGTRQSRLEIDPVFQKNQRTFRYNSRLKSRFSIEKRNSQLAKIREKQKSAKKLKENGSLKILKNGEIERLSSIKNPFPGKETLDEIYNEIISRYRFVDDLTAEKKQEMIDKTLSSLVAELGDKYSIYIKPAKSEKFVDSLNGEFEGIGAYVEMIDGKFTIVSPIVGSPAEKSGILPGDIVTEVDGEKVLDLSIREIVDLIMGPAGTEVKLKISRDSRDLSVKVIRDKIIEPAVALKWKKSIPVIGIHQFNHDTINLLQKILDEVLQKKPRGIVFDLRNNPGGYLDSAVDVGSLFLDKGKVVFYTEDRTQTKPFVAEKKGELANFDNIVVLQNKGTASASEIVIGMLQDYGKARTVGEKSVGKGTVQTVRSLKNGGMLKLTIAKWLTPHKRWIHEVGIIPDIEVSKPTTEERGKGIDRQLDTAVREVLRR